MAHIPQFKYSFLKNSIGRWQMANDYTKYMVYLPYWLEKVHKSKIRLSTYTRYTFYLHWDTLKSRSSLRRMCRRFTTGSWKKASLPEW